MKNLGAKDLVMAKIEDEDEDAAAGASVHEQDNGEPMGHDALSVKKE